MSMGAHEISESSRRIARNTVFLYFRMFLLMIIGLVTTRIILRTLGFDDYGLYKTVGSVVAISNILSASLAAAISRYINVALGTGDNDKSARVFSTSLTVMATIAVLIVVVMETVGLWFLNFRLNVPDGRLGAANVVFQCSLGVLVLQLLNVPFNASITAHERMSAFAYISILEAVLKLSVAVGLLLSGGDKLKLYAILLLVVAIIVRGAYMLYCRRHFDETRRGLSFEKPLFREMFGFAGWNFLGSGAFLLNTEGVNIVTNLFYGVAMNAPRGIAGQVEGIVKQFVNNIVIAINPQITQSYVSGRKDYSFELACKGSKYAVLIILLFLVPYTFEPERISYLLFSRNPEGSGLFTTLAIVCVLADLILTTFATLQLATGNIKRYYIVTSSLSILILPLTWVAFSAGAPAWTAYLIFAAIYVVVDVVKLFLIRSQTGFPLRKFVHDVLLKVIPVASVSFAFTAAVWTVLPDGWWRMAAVVAVSALATAVSSWFFALTEGERSFALSRLCRKSS